MTTSPEALREAQPVKCLGERFQDAFLRGWGDDRLVAYADLPAEAQAKWNRAALAFVCTLSDAPSELKSAIQEAREALDDIDRGYLVNHSSKWVRARVRRALSPGGAE